MKMRPLIASVLVSFLPFTATLAADQGKGPKKGKQSQANNEATTNVAAHVVFSAQDAVILRDYYAPRYRDLPPGLQKKVARGSTLPPGWQKKLESFPAVLAHRLAPLPRGYGRGVIDGHAVIYNTRTNLVVDVAALF
jgi:hypothetical protein